jgi:hypothetical protein
VQSCSLYFVQIPVTVIENWVVPAVTERFPTLRFAICYFSRFLITDNKEKEVRHLNLNLCFALYELPNKTKICVHHSSVVRDSLAKNWRWKSLLLYDIIIWKHRVKGSKLLWYYAHMALKVSVTLWHNYMKTSCERFETALILCTYGVESLCYSTT